MQQRILVGGWLIAADRIEQCLESNSAKHLSRCFYQGESHPTELEWETQMSSFPFDLQETGCTTSYIAKHGE